MIYLFQIRIGLIWVLSILLAIPQGLAFRVMLVDVVVPQCIPVNISAAALKWKVHTVHTCEHKSKFSGENPHTLSECQPQ
jgi:hypothetical protein